MLLLPWVERVHVDLAVAKTSGTILTAGRDDILLSVVLNWCGPHACLRYMTRNGEIEHVASVIAYRIEWDD